MSTRSCRFYSNDIQPFSDDRLAWKRLYLELGSIVFNNTYDLLVSALKSSSCDNDNQSIENTLGPNKKFWSSRGSNDISSSEYLLYKLEQPICIVSSIQIHVYKAFFQPGQPIYSPQSIRISVGFTPDNMHYTSEEFMVEQTDEPQTFYFDPILVVGGYLRVDLIGHHQSQANDGLFYTVLKYVCVDGRTLGSLDNKPELCLSLVQMAAKHIDVRHLLPHSARQQLANQVDAADNNRTLFSKVHSFLKGQMAPKLDKMRVYNHIMYSILKDIVEGHYSAAASNAIIYNMRSTKIFNLFQSTSDSAISQYYMKLLDSGLKFTQEETLYMVKEAFETDNVRMFTMLFLSDLVYLSESLGDYLLLNGYALLAAEVFNRSLIPDKVVQSLFISGNHIDTIHLIEAIQAEQQVDLINLIKLIKSYSLHQACQFTLSLLEHLPGQLSPEDISSVIEVGSTSLEEITVELKERIKIAEGPRPQIKKRQSTPLAKFFKYYSGKFQEQSDLIID
ncbi:hypothetical protein SAMD00019534_082210 [Acytostelium subglobosum LB1]|uniref:hypothetical protein n=1 Tax=Acytostelium subglobosum LB1 TaxID=1410327 RepID=UPI000644D7F4|nr:hypothetical protein SAMD00019534_082210 [Acytostelium subglobosum LB1]GAM25046.1 hypothetical protein SAMD00019534_082210 [Acytostelium subglobosum LB1]|eukprot:XP_012752135.1 hypothetical protein SAMD00019534_082210 [Acytostelium subglobosum LB1]